MFYIYRTLSMYHVRRNEMHSHDKVIDLQIFTHDEESLFYAKKFCHCFMQVDC